MNTYLVTRHPGAVKWAAAHGHRVNVTLSHFGPADMARLDVGDKVIGTLPVNLIAQVCMAGADYWHLTMDIPAAMRGRELTPDDMDACGAELVRYYATAIPVPPGTVIDS